MISSKSILAVVAAIGFTVCSACTSFADSPALVLADLFDSPSVSSVPTSPSDLRRSMPTAAELRQQRALYQMRQRVERLETAAWLGITPLRPNWNAIPMTTSRYAPRTIYYVPVFVR